MRLTGPASSRSWSTPIIWPIVIERHLAGRRAPPVRLCIEAERLETGGGVANALPMLGEQPFFVVNGDMLWRDGPRADAG